MIQSSNIFYYSVRFFLWFIKLLEFSLLQIVTLIMSYQSVFVGTCFGMRSWTPATQNLFVAMESMCFNPVVLKASVARRIFESGACVDTFAAVDHLFNNYISNLNLNVFYVYPPLAYEQSKNEIQSPC